METKQDEKLSKIKNFEISQLSQNHNIHNYEELTKPDRYSYEEIFEKYHLKQNLKNWINSFNDKKDDQKNSKI